MVVGQDMRTGKETHRMLSIVSFLAAGIALSVSLAFFLTDTVLPRERWHIQPTSTPTASQAQQAVGQQAQDILDRCVKGRLAFRPPSPLKQGQTVEFAVRVAPSTSRVNPADGLPGTASPSMLEPSLCESMRAELTSSKGIKIEAATSDTISLPRSGAGEWGWHLTGVEPGQHQMVLRLYAPNPDGGDITLPALRETITVDVDLGYSFATFVKDMSQPLQAFVGILVIVGGWMTVLLVKRSRGKHEASAKNEK